MSLLFGIIYKLICNCLFDFSSYSIILNYLNFRQKLSCRGPHVQVGAPGAEWASTVLDFVAVSWEEEEATEEATKEATKVATEEATEEATKVATEEPTEVEVTGAEATGAEAEAEVAEAEVNR